MVEFNLDFVSDKSANRIAQEVHRLVSTGALKPGERLPPVRQLAGDIGVSPATVGQAWKILAEHGVLETKGRNGTFVVDPDRREPWRQFRRVAGVDLPRDLSTGFPDLDLLPDMAPFLIEAAERHKFRGYESTTALPELQEALTQELPSFNEETILLATHVIGLMTEVLPVIGGYRTGVIVGAAEFAPYLDLLERSGMTAFPVEHDDEGLAFEGVDAAIEQGATAIILQPRVHNPTGVPMSLDRLRRISVRCAEADVAIIESDYFGGLSSSPRMTASHWAPEQTLHIRSFSKDLHPDLRVVAAVGAPKIVQTMRRRRVGGFDVSGINQQLLRLMLESPIARRATSEAKKIYDARRATFVSELARGGVQVKSSDGLNVWVPVRSEQDALVHLASNGISAAPGSAFQVHGGQPHLRVSIAGMGDEAAAIAHLVAAAAGAFRMKS